MIFKWKWMSFHEFLTMEDDYVESDAAGGAVGWILSLVRASASEQVRPHGARESLFEQFCSAKSRQPITDSRSLSVIFWRP